MWPVPITLQTYVVLVAGSILGWRRATSGIMLYLALGFVGAPMFAAATGATFGYLVAFLAAPYIVTKLKSPSVGILTASLLIYLLGAGWLMFWLHYSLLQAITLGVLPFILGDVLKAIAAYLTIKRYGK